MTTHYAYDYLVLADAFGEVMGFVPVQKTTKTLCGKRVKMAKISRNPDCPDCLREDREREEFAEWCRQQLHKPL